MLFFPKIIINLIILVVFSYPMSFLSSTACLALFNPLHFLSDFFLWIYDVHFYSAIVPWYSIRL